MKDEKSNHVVPEESIIEWGKIVPPDISCVDHGVRDYIAHISKVTQGKNDSVETGLMTAAGEINPNNA